MSDKKNYVEPSQATANYLKHVQAIELLAEQPPSTSFAVAKNELRYSVLRDLLKRACVGKLAFVVIEHDEVFEIQRLPDGTDTRTFYRHYAKLNNKPEIETQMEVVINIANQYLKSDYESNVKYDNKLTLDMLQAGIIAYGYLQKRCINMAAFKRSENSTNAFKNAIKELTNQGFLNIVSKDVAKETFNRSCELYEVGGQIK